MAQPNRTPGSNREAQCGHEGDWQDGSWLGLDDAALLIACAEAGLVLVAFDRATLPWHAGQVLRSGQSYGWAQDGRAWDWLNRIVYLPKSTSAS